MRKGFSQALPLGCSAGAALLLPPPATTGSQLPLAPRAVDITLNTLLGGGCSDGEKTTTFASNTTNTWTSSMGMTQSDNIVTQRPIPGPFSSWGRPPAWASVANAKADRRFGLRRTQTARQLS